jgi:2'-5' RNA ligase
MVPQPAATEIDGLRRACGDGALERVAPHLTLVPPVNVSETRLFEALSLLRRSASGLSPFELQLGPVTTFLPDSPTLYLAVGGPESAVQSLSRLRDEIFKPPLERTLSFPFVPHVTIGDDLPPERIDHAVQALSSYTTTIECTSVHLLQEQRAEGRVRWTPIADHNFGPPIPVGRGSLPLELWISAGVDPEGRGLLDAEEPGGLLDERPVQAVPDGWRSLTISARRRDELVGVATGGTDGRHSQLVGLVVAPAQRGQGIARHLYTWFVAEGGPPVELSA